MQFVFVNARGLTQTSRIFSFFLVLEIFLASVLFHELLQPEISYIFEKTVFILDYFKRLEFFWSMFRFK